MTQRDKVIYFVEVKYRGQSAQGGGFDYIGAQKQHKMEFAAKTWCQTYSWEGDYRLMAAAVSGDDCQEIQLVELG